MNRRTAVLVIAALNQPVYEHYIRSYWTAVVAFLGIGLLLFVRPVQALVLTPILGARKPTED